MAGDNMLRQEVEGEFVNKCILVHPFMKTELYKDVNNIMSTYVVVYNDY